MKPLLALVTLLVVAACDPRYSAVNIVRETPTQYVIHYHEGQTVPWAIQEVERINRLGLTVVLPANAECRSACTILVAGANKQLVDDTARLGFHGASVNGKWSTQTYTVASYYRGDLNDWYWEHASSLIYPHKYLTGKEYKEKTR